MEDKWKYSYVESSGEIYWQIVFGGFTQKHLQTYLVDCFSLPNGGKFILELTDPTTCADTIPEILRHSNFLGQIRAIPILPAILKLQFKCPKIREIAATDLNAWTKLRIAYLKTV